MKRIALIIYYLVIICPLFIACDDDFLEKPPSVDVTEAVIFENEDQALTFVTGTYRIGVPLGYPVDYGTNMGVYGAVRAAICDESEAGPPWTSAHNWNNASINASTITTDEDDRFDLRWQAVRRCNILLERIREVPNASEEFKDQVEGEARFLRALQYFEGVKRYGGIPIVDRRLNPSDELLLKRNSLEECVNFIVEDCDAAIALLPSTRPSSMRGRATKGAALALKARVLLYAASPLFNSPTPYLDFGENNNLISYGNYDQQRWQKAADAAKATLDWAASSGCALVTSYGPDQNYLMITEEQDNEEVILANQSFNGWTRWDQVYGIIMPRFAGGYSNGGMSVPLNFVKFYEKKDGTKQDWKMTGGDNLLAMYDELEPRFKQTIAYHQSVWNNERGIVDLSEGSAHRNFCLGSHWMRKLIPHSLLFSGANAPVMNWIVFRLGETYLNYAEAVNEANNGPTEEAYLAVDAIRARSGMPPVPRGLTQSEFRERVRSERAVELAFEEHRFWDIRRWKIADQEGVMQGKFYGLRITPVGGGSTEFHYLPYVFEERIWNDKMYLHPFKIEEIYKGYLVQNPGW